MITPLLLSLALNAAAAQRLPDCIHVSTSSAQYLPDLDAVRDCQNKARLKAQADAKKKGKPLTYAQLEAFDDLQRAGVKEYLEKSGTIIDGATKSDRPLDAAVKIDSDASVVADLEKRLRAAAGKGENGITPAMGKDIVETLTKRSGALSPEMKELLEAVTKDGGKLSAETMKKLQDAGRAAKGANLDLHIDKATEKALLEHDFDKDKAPAPSVN